MNVSQKGIDLIKKFEGCRLEAYRCPAGVWTIGYGHTALTRCIKGEGLREDVPFVCYKLMDNDKVFLCTDGMYNAAEKDMLHISVDKLKKRISMPEDDASLIAISL